MRYLLTILTSPRQYTLCKHRCGAVQSHLCTSLTSKFSLLLHGQKHVSFLSFSSVMYATSTIAAVVPASLLHLQPRVDLLSSSLRLPVPSYHPCLASFCLIVSSMFPVLSVCCFNIVLTFHANVSATAVIAAPTLISSTAAFDRATPTCFSDIWKP